MSDDISAGLGVRNLVLCGFMGTGKTAVGRVLAERWDRPFVDIDELIELRDGRTITNIFRISGEAAFRKIEQEVVEEVAQRRSQVIAVGGGVMLHRESAERLAALGVVVCLTATPEVIRERVAQNRHRPLLEGDNSVERIAMLLKERSGAYEQVHLTIDTATDSVETVAEHVAQAVVGYIYKEGE